MRRGPRKVNHRNNLQNSVVAIAVIAVAVLPIAATINGAKDAYTKLSADQSPSTQSTTDTRSSSAVIIGDF